MNILYIHQYFSTPSGSSGTRSYEMAKRLISRGHHVTMVCGTAQLSKTGLSKYSQKGMRRGLVDGIDVIELDLPYSNHYGFIKRSVIFLKYAWHTIILSLKLEYDIIFATSTPLTAGIPGIFASIIRRKPFVFEVRDLWPELPKAMGVINNPIVLKVLDILEWCCYHSAKLCIGLSPGIIEGIKRRGIPENKTVMIPNACDLELFDNNNNDEKHRIKEKYSDQFIAIFTGAHGIANGLDAVLDAASILKNKGKHNIKIMFIGDGSKKPDMIKRCKRDNLDNCIFIEPVSKINIIQYLQNADVGLMILANIPEFYYGTSPNKFFDYIASGLPVINNYPGWLAEMIKVNNCGIAVKPDNPEALANALVNMASDKEKLKIMSFNAKSLARKEFNRKTIADTFVDAIESVVKK